MPDYPSAKSSRAEGVVYLLHFDQPYKHARHYTGWAADLDARLAEHQAGRGARLLAVVKAAGIGWTLARTWPGTRTRERQLKNQGGASRHCPQCGITPRSQGTPMPPAQDPRAAARCGRQAAETLITAQADAGLTPEAIADRHDDIAARLLSEADSPAATAYAREYSFTATVLAADLAELHRAPELPPVPGTAHPDPFLAARGWQVSDHGIYVRTGQAREPELEAG